MKRTIEVDIKQAKEWYNFGDSVLRELATTAYTVEELTSLSYEEIIRLEMSGKDYISFSGISYPSIFIKHRDYNKIAALTKLQLVANYFNGNWKKELGNTGYFILPKSVYVNTKKTIIYEVGTHINVMYSMPYFRNKKDAQEAIKILGSKNLSRLFD